ncbi:hypothetical protein FB451DRAFT_1178734 [Mycena latifolia]|nr:hypothetical protein FB451DRAFT_1178734 [Mycena latifolia]
MAGANTPCLALFKHGATLHRRRSVASTTAPLNLAPPPARTRRLGDYAPRTKGPWILDCYLRTARVPPPLMRSQYATTAPSGMAFGPRPPQLSHPLLLFPRDVALRKEPRTDERVSRLLIPPPPCQRGHAPAACRIRRARRMPHAPGRRVQVADCVRVRVRVRRMGARRRPGPRATVIVGRRTRSCSRCPSLNCIGAPSVALARSQVVAQVSGARPEKLSIDKTKNSSLPNVANTPESDVKCGLNWTPREPFLPSFPHSAGPSMYGYHAVNSNSSTYSTSY